MSRQLSLIFTKEEPADRTPQRKEAGESPAVDSVQEIAEALRPQLLEYLRQADDEIEMRELRNALGYPGAYLDPDPQSNPVNRLVKQMRDAGELTVREFDRGSPLVSLPSSEETSSAVAPPPLVRPDRQCTFEGVPHYEWPKPEEDRDSITVDRLYEDIDGQCHRFLIRRGDRVEAFFRRDKVECGEVVGISHARGEVRVRFGDTGEGIWFAVGQIYPAPELQPEKPKTVPLSSVVEAASVEPEGGFTEADRVPNEAAVESAGSAVTARESQPPGVDSLAEQRPYTLRDFREYRDRFDAGEASLQEHLAGFARVRATKDAFVTDLKQQYDADRLKVLASRFGCFDATRNSKQKNAEHVYRVVLQSFVLESSVQFNPMQESIEDATARVVAGLTEDVWREHHEKVAKERADLEQALSDPQTIEQFRSAIRENGLESLSAEQRVRFDELSADASRAVRKAKVTDTVTKIEGEGIDGVEFSIKEGWHDRKECTLWIVQLSTRVERDVYKELLSKARMLGGYYSSFKKADAGFQFFEEEKATRFTSLLEGDVDRSDVLADRKARKMESAGGRLAGVAATLESEAAEILDADEGKLKNTVRRSEMAAGMRGRAYGNRAMAGTLRSIATALDAGGAQYLDGVRAATHVEALIGILRRAKTKRNDVLLKERGELGMWERHTASEELSNRPLEIADAGFAEYPYPAIYRRHLEELVAVARTKTGLKQLSRRLDSFLVTDRERHFVDFVDDRDVAFLQDYLARCRGVRLETRWVEQGMEDWKRLRAANIFTPQELRCSLRELVPHLRKRDGDDPVQMAEAKLIGMKLPGFFPTPRPVISRMLEFAEMKDGDRVLEPSCGKGDILDMIREQHPDTSVTAIEQNRTLFDVLETKGHEVSSSDFLEYSGEHDVIVMNPPFENLADIDHVQHAYEQLAAGGRLVAVMSAGGFFRSDKKAEQFRAWIEQLDAEVEELPEDAFKGVEAFRQTGVRTKLVLLSRPESSPIDH